jgi:hypothetical protein
VIRPPCATSPRTARAGQGRADARPRRTAVPFPTRAARRCRTRSPGAPARPKPQRTTCKSIAQAIEHWGGHRRHHRRQADRRVMPPPPASVTMNLASVCIKPLSWAGKAARQDGVGVHWDRDPQTEEPPPTRARRAGEDGSLALPAPRTIASSAILRVSSAVAAPNRNPLGQVAGLCAPLRFWKP